MRRKKGTGERWRGSGKLEQLSWSSVSLDGTTEVIPEGTHKCLRMGTDVQSFS